MSAMIDFSIYIKDNADLLARRIVDAAVLRMGADIPEEEQGKAVWMYEELLGFFGESLLKEDDGTVPQALIDWSKNNAAIIAKSKGVLSQIVVRYPPTRDVINDLLTDISEDLGLTVREHAFVLKRINQMLDVSLNETFFAFEQLSSQYRKETESELAKLSAPLVPVRDGVVVLPLIGEINEIRANHIMDSVIAEIAEMGVEYVITDFSGILKIDAEVVNYLYRIDAALQLMGITAITTGLRPKLAQAVVQAGIDLSSIKTFATVKQALESLPD